MADISLTASHGELPIVAQESTSAITETETATQAVPHNFGCSLFRLPPVVIAAIAEPRNMPDPEDVLQLTASNRALNQLLNRQRAQALCLRQVDRLYIGDALFKTKIDSLLSRVSLLPGADRFAPLSRLNGRFYNPPYILSALPSAIKSLEPPARREAMANLSIHVRTPTETREFLAHMADFPSDERIFLVRKLLENALCHTKEPVWHEFREAIAKYTIHERGLLLPELFERADRWENVRLILSDSQDITNDEHRSAMLSRLFSLSTLEYDASESQPILDDIIASIRRLPDQLRAAPLKSLCAGFDIRDPQDRWRVFSQIFDEMNALPEDQRAEPFASLVNVATASADYELNLAFYDRVFEAVSHLDTHLRVAPLTISLTRIPCLSPQSQISRLDSVLRQIAGLKGGISKHSLSNALSRLSNEESIHTAAVHQTILLAFRQIEWEHKPIILQEWAKEIPALSKRDLTEIHAAYLETIAGLDLGLRNVILAPLADAVTQLPADETPTAYSSILYLRGKYSETSRDISLHKVLARSITSLLNNKRFPEIIDAFFDATQEVDEWYVSDIYRLIDMTHLFECTNIQATIYFLGRFLPAIRDVSENQRDLFMRRIYAAALDDDDRDHLGVRQMIEAAANQYLTGGSATLSQ